MDKFKIIMKVLLYVGPRDNRKRKLSSLTPK